MLHNALHVQSNNYNANTNTPALATTTGYNDNIFQVTTQGIQSINGVSSFCGVGDEIVVSNGVSKFFTVTPVQYNAATSAVGTLAVTIAQLQQVGRIITISVAGTQTINGISTAMVVGQAWEYNGVSWLNIVADLSPYNILDANNTFTGINTFTNAAGLTVSPYGVTGMTSRMNSNGIALTGKMTNGTFQQLSILDGNGLAANSAINFVVSQYNAAGASTYNNTFMQVAPNTGNVQFNGTVAASGVIASSTDIQVNNASGAVGVANTNGIGWLSELSANSLYFTNGGSNYSANGTTVNGQCYLAYGNGAPSGITVFSNPGAQGSTCYIGSNSTGAGNYNGIIFGANQARPWLNNLATTNNTSSAIATLGDITSSGGGIVASGYNWQQFANGSVEIIGRIEIGVNTGGVFPLPISVPNFAGGNYTVVCSTGNVSGGLGSAVVGAFLVSANQIGINCVQFNGGSGAILIQYIVKGF